MAVDGLTMKHFGILTFLTEESVAEGVVSFFLELDLEDMGRREGLVYVGWIFLRDEMMSVVASEGVVGS